jgi:EAL domain-containing protein (putative c-di-GMP-specific phosphodiesterase class I)/DNA-binding response OmpR family regulator
MSSEEPHATTPILFVDDEPEVRRAFARAMSVRGFDVDLAADATEAVLQASGRRYALIATDLDLPEVDGLRLVERLYSIQPETPCILVTGVRELRLPCSPAADRISSVVTKPWDPDELAQRIWRSVSLEQERVSDRSPRAPDPGMALGNVLLLESNSGDPRSMLHSLVDASLPGYQLIRSGRLCDALCVAQARALGLIVSELSLPDARGLDAIRALREVAPSTPLVVIGKSDDEVLALSSLRAGAQDYLVREQLTPEGVRRALRFAIERHRADDSAPKSRSLAPADSGHFPECVTSALARARREGHRVAVIYVNLRRGRLHAEGVAEPLSGSLIGRAMDRVRRTLREYDTLAHLGRDRLGIIIPAIERGDRASVPARRLLAELSQPFISSGLPVSLDVTLGIGIYPDDADTAEELCRCADMAGCRAQAFGSGAYEFFDEECQASSRARHALESELERALAERQFVLQYRPQHALDTGGVVAAEVVLSWRRPNGELWEADRFLAALEGRKLAAKLTAWMLREACCQGKAWQAQHPGLLMALDLTPSQLADPELCAELARALGESGFPPEQLELELPEAAVQREGAPGVLAALAALGVRLSIDDFGHQLSLARLGALPISAIKIGPSLADLAGNDARGAALIQAAADLSRDLRIDLSAMGVDEPSQLDFLQRIGCRRAQGELYGPARTADATWLSAS